MEKEPPRFECYYDSDQEWHPCVKEEICDNNLPRDHWRPVKEDDEYINNWVEKWDMLCEPKWKIGLLGALAFFGVLISTAFVPVLSDKIGRKVIYVITLGLSVLIQLWFILSTSIYEAYCCFFLLGLTAAGRMIVGLSYVLELNIVKIHDKVIFFLLLAETGSIILLTAWY